MVFREKSHEIPLDHDEPAGRLVVHVVRQFYPNRGGLEDVVMNLGLAMQRRGFRVRVVTLDRLFTEPDRLLPAHEIRDGIEIVRIPWRGSTRYPVALDVFRHLADADLIHVHAIDFFFDALALGRFLHRKPMVATTHGGFFHTARHAFVKKVWFQTLTRMSARAYKVIVGCSRSDTALFSSIAPNRTVLIENGADTAKFAGSSSAVPVKRIVTIGRFSVNKRIDRLLDALKVLVAGDGDWRLEIVGVPGGLTAADLEGMIAARGLRRQVRIHCDLENAAIAGLLGECSLFASASEYEGFGLVAVEAMSAGLVPVLNTNEAYRLLGERHSRLVLADFASPEQAARAITQAYDALCADDSLRPGLVADAQHYSWNSVADRYQAVYEEVAGAAPAVAAGRARP
ncbi:glycosyltransferase family 4 protein [Rhizobiaceae bacterium BDR2-2]|uniref:Glycosyltransferase family 4 protein n=1 Tax=Ectorhizobium quercum TaxID=2965071 RepID=A0AAE3N2I8_9HYPH|nr:glycosyltransferase family 4 protein [Ectorhizobium quercum]MCX8999628.1 glycosyltransferase family 4 protein [Ectorhizobium quercum]